MKITIPELSLVTLVGISSAGKTTFAKRFFKDSEIVSSDACRAMVSDDENSMEATKDAFDLAHYIISTRLKRGNLTVMDATNIQPHARKPLLDLCKKHHVLNVAIVLDTSQGTAKKRNAEREDRNISNRIINRQHQQFQHSIKNLQKEGFRAIHKIRPEDLDDLVIEREKLYNNKKHEKSPLDFIGDVHGCFDELCSLLEKLGYSIETHEDQELNYGYSVSHPEDRKAVFVGDLTDRGPLSNKVLRLVMSMVKTEVAYCVSGNHDFKLAKKLGGKSVSLTHGLAETMEQLEGESEAFIEEAHLFLKKLTSHYIFDEGRVLVAHAGLREKYHGRASGKIRSLCMFGEVNGEKDEYGMPIRYNWAKEYTGDCMVIYGHTPVLEAEWYNNTIDIDTGCVFGGKLTALRYPEKEIISVPALETYAEASKPMGSIIEREEDNGMVNIEDVTGQRVISTSLMGNLKIKEENSISALETMTRFAINPKWLTYLPPTMSPSATSKLEGYLEHPKEALEYFEENEVQKIVCQEKHMGSRAIITVCQDKESAKNRFGADENEIGIIYTRNGRKFFDNKHVEQQLLTRIQTALSKSGFWKKFKTQWVTLDCEIMPWSSKAQGLLQSQYGATGTASRLALQSVQTLMKKAKNRSLEVNDLANEIDEKLENTQKFTEAYRHYCWSVHSLDDYRIAPFHILATEEKVHTDKNHEWHMQQIHSFCEFDNILQATNYKVINLESGEQKQEAIDWWLELTEKGGEGLVFKPYDFITYNGRTMIQPAIKCRGREYLRIIYGAEYTTNKNLEKLKNRSLKGKRSLALREFALGMEAINRFVSCQAIRKVHEAVFGVMALESEIIDPRL